MPVYILLLLLAALPLAAQRAPGNDFIHRDPNPADPTMVIKPYLSTTEIVSETTMLSNVFGEQWSFVETHKIPFTGSAIKSLRKGPSFWDNLI